MVELDDSSGDSLKLKPENLVEWHTPSPPSRPPTVSPPLLVQTPPPDLFSFGDAPKFPGGGAAGGGGGATSAVAGGGVQTSGGLGANVGGASAGNESHAAKVATGLLPCPTFYYFHPPSPFYFFSSS